MEREREREVRIYIYIYISLSLSLYIIYMYIIYMYSYIHRVYIPPRRVVRPRHPKGERGKGRREKEKGEARREKGEGKGEKGEGEEQGKGEGKKEKEKGKEGRMGEWENESKTVCTPGFRSKAAAAKYSMIRLSGVLAAMRPMLPNLRIVFFIWPNVASALLSPPTSTKYKMNNP